MKWNAVQEIKSSSLSSFISPYWGRDVTERGSMTFFKADNVFHKEFIYFNFISPLYSKFSFPILVYLQNLTHFFAPILVFCMTWSSIFPNSSELITLSLFSSKLWNWALSNCSRRWEGTRSRNLLNSSFDKPEIQLSLNYIFGEKLPYSSSWFATSNFKRSFKLSKIHIIFLNNSNFPQDSFWFWDKICSIYKTR